MYICIFIVLVLLTKSVLKTCRTQHTYNNIGPICLWGPRATAQCAHGLTWQCVIVRLYNIDNDIKHVIIMFYKVQI